MTLWLLDASVFLASDDPDDDQHLASRELMAGQDPLLTLDLAFYETVNIAVRAWQDAVATRRIVARLTAVVEEGGIVRATSELLARAAELAQQHGISVYDAAYSAAAAGAGARLVSCDRRDLVGKGLAALPMQAVRGSSL